jgi:hypothetical protein
MRQLMMNRGEDGELAAGMNVACTEASGYRETAAAQRKT